MEICTDITNAKKGSDASLGTDQDHAPFFSPKKLTLSLYFDTWLPWVDKNLFFYDDNFSFWFSSLFYLFTFSFPMCVVQHLYTLWRGSFGLFFFLCYLFLLAQYQSVALQLAIVIILYCCWWEKMSKNQVPIKISACFLLPMVWQLKRNRKRGKI